MKGNTVVLVPAWGLELVQPIPLADYFYRNPTREGNKCLKAILRLFMKRTFPLPFSLGLFLEPEESSPHFSAILRIHFNIILYHKVIPCLV
jgi:hypothetical protein